MDVQEQRQRIVKGLGDHGWRNRDADVSDFQFGTDPALRFKVGTQHKEITVAVWTHSRQTDLRRATSEAQVTELIHWLDGLIHAKMERNRVEPGVYGG